MSEPVDSRPRPITPHRPPQWGYLQAKKDAAERRLRAPGAAGRHVRAMTAVLSRFNSKERGPLIAQREVEEPAIESLTLFDDRERGSLVEALILARLPAGAIARRMKLPLNQVQAYEELFFDVSESLHYRDYILRWAIAPEWSVGASGSHRRRVAMKTLAYLSGAQALDDIFGLRNEKSPHYWSHPSEVVKQLALENAVCEIADLVPYPGKRSDGGIQGAVAVDAICTLLREVCSEIYPTYDMEYSMRQQRSTSWKTP